MTLLHCAALDFDLTPLSGKFSLVPDCGRLLEFRLLTYILVWSQEANKVRATPRLIALGCQCFEQVPDPTSKVLYDWCSCLQQLTGSSVRTKGLEFGFHLELGIFSRLSGLRILLCPKKYTYFLFSEEYSGPFTMKPPRRGPKAFEQTSISLRDTTKLGPFPVQLRTPGYQKILRVTRYKGR